MSEKIQTECAALLFLEQILNIADAEIRQSFAEDCFLEMKNAEKRAMLLTVNKYRCRIPDEHLPIVDQAVEILSQAKRESAK